METGASSTFLHEETNMFDMQQVGERIAALRRRENMTQAELAEKLGISYQAVSSWERGATMPDIGKLVELARILRTTVDALLSGERAEDAPLKEAQNEEKAADSRPGRSLGEELRRLVTSLKESLTDIKESLSTDISFVGAEGIKIEKKGRNSFVMHMPDGAEGQTDRGRPTADMIAALAWNMDQQTLEDVLVNAINDGDEEIVEEIAGLVESDTVERALSRAQQAPTCEMLEELGAAMSGAALEECLVRAIDEGDDEAVEAIADHLDADVLERALQRCGGELTVDMVEALSCFASERALDLIIQKCDTEDAEVIEELAPYLNQRQMRELLGRMRNG